MNRDTEDLLCKRFKTTMIGAISEFEKSFGYLWGIHKSENEDLTEREEQFLDIWENTRNRILNNGNNQLRRALSDVNKLEGNQQYKYNFKYRERN